MTSHPAAPRHRPASNWDGAMPGALQSRLKERLLADADVAEYADWTADRMGTILRNATVREGTTDGTTRRIIIDAITYDPAGPGGSRSDYIAYHIEDTLAEYRVRLPQDFDYRPIIAAIRSRAIHPDRALRFYSNLTGDR